MESQIRKIIGDTLAELNRPDLYRSPLVAFSSAHDPEYSRLKNIIGDWHLLPVELLTEAKSAISYFIPFTREVALAPRKAANPSALWAEAYQEINKHFEKINQAVYD